MAALLLFLHPGMKTMHLLLGSSERRLSALIEAAVLDVCYNRAAIESTRITHLSEFVRNSSCGSFDVLVLLPHHLLPEEKQGAPGPEALVQAIWTVKNRCASPLLVVGSSSEMEYRFLEAGADAVLGITFKPEELRAELDKLITLPEETERPRAPKWSLAALFGRHG
jgi:hypothetical protein